MKNVTINLCLLLFASPIIYLVIVALTGQSPYFHSLIHNHLLDEYLLGSLRIGFFTSLFCLIIGVGMAWLVSFQQFPMRRLFEWLLIMPLATPSYIAAMLYAHLLESAGVVQTAIRTYFNLDYGQYYFPNIRSESGVIFILTFTLYPYVYMLMRTAFLMQSVHVLESATMLGCTRFALFWRIAFPLARPAAIAGVALVMMESLADFGVSSLYGVTTLNTGIYRAWQSMMDGTAAARLALMLVIIAIALLWLERRQRGLALFINYNALYHPIKRFDARRIWQLIFCISCAIPVLIGFIIPVLLLCVWSVGNFMQAFNQYNFAAAKYSVQIALMVAFVTAMIGGLTAFIVSNQNNKGSENIVAVATRFIVTIATGAYGFSGNIIAISVLLIIIMLQNNILPNIALTASLFGVIWGCSLRFLTISHQTIHSGMERISDELSDVSTMLGCNKWQTLLKVKLPLLKGSIIVALLLVFVDTLKELPATIMLRPFNVTTLSIRIYELAKDEMLSIAAPLALLLLLISSIAVIYVNRQLLTSRPSC